MVASTDIKFFVHTNKDIPQLTDSYGSMIALLDACLVNGLSVGVVESMVASGAEITASFSTAHQLQAHQVVEISGAIQAEYNGQFRITEILTPKTLKFKMVAAPSAGAASGAIICRLPPIDWELAFSSVGKRAYRSKNLLLPSRPYLRVVDELNPAYEATYAKYAKVGIVEEMTNIDTLVGVQAPYDAANPSKNWIATGVGSAIINGWAKWYYARYSETADVYSGRDVDRPAEGSRNFTVSGNQDYFFIMNGVTPADVNTVPLGFGALNAQDKAFFLSASDNSRGVLSDALLYNVTPFINTLAASLYLIKNISGDSATNNTGKSFGLSVGSANISTGATNYLSATTNISSPVYAMDAANAFRGEVPSLRWLYTNKPYIAGSAIVSEGNIYRVIGAGLNGQYLIKVGDYEY